MSTLGPIQLEFEGPHPARALIESELAFGEPSDAAQKLVVTIDSDPPPIPGARLDGSRLMLRHSVAQRGDGLRLTMGLKHSLELYSVDIGPDLLHSDVAHAIIYLPRNLDRWSRALVPFARILSRDTASLLETAAKNTIYELIDGIAEYRLLRTRASFVHASALAWKSGTVLIAGMGGVGKSTSLLAAMARYEELSYMGDDLVIVQSDGRVWRHPKRVQIYRYNLAANTGLQRSLLSGLSPWRRFIWKARAKLLGPKQARFRVSAEEVFGAGRVSDKGTLKAVVWATPSSGDALAVRELDSAIAARRCAVALTDELWDLSRLMSLGSVLSPAGLSVGDFVSGVVDVYDSAFAHVPVLEVSIPHFSDPDALARTIADIIVG